LQRFGRGGVPLVLIYPGELSKPPIVLPPILTPAKVLDALGKAAPKGKAGSARTRDSAG